jgi:hypothetical protein
MALSLEGRALVVRPKIDIRLLQRGSRKESRTGLETSTTQVSQIMLTVDSNF